MQKKKHEQGVIPLHILVVDHDPQTFRILESTEAEVGIQATHASTLQEATSNNNVVSYDIILLNDRLPDGTASEAIAAMQKAASSPELLVYSKHGDPAEAEKILGSGCWDYIVDPSLPRTIIRHLKKVIRYRRAKSEQALDHHETLYQDLRSEGIIGSSPAMQHCLNLMIKAAQSNANVLITGESGTGKELFASSIHSVSPRVKNEFVVVDCAAMTETLVEAILFGHVKGAYTGADRNKIGLVKKADGGTLFLDEIGELPLEMQKKFLRFLQEQTFRPVGSSNEMRSDFRLIAASNKNLQELTRKHEFREDLLFRIQTFHLELPPLRARTEDITELAYYYRDRYYNRHRITKDFSTAFLMVLKQYDWPGNVRELFHAMERAFASALDTDILYPLHLPPDVRIAVSHKTLKHSPDRDKPPGPSSEPDQIDLSMDMQSYRDKVVEKAEKSYLRELVSFADGDLAQCLQISGLSRSRFYALLKKYAISLQSRRR